jgi:hypothetical protein
VAETLLVLGQAKPAPATLTNAYTVPAGTSAVVSTITVCEQSGVATTFRISVAVAGAADSSAQYLAYDAPLDANEPLSFTLGITLAATDVVRVQSASGAVSFNLFGTQVTGG